MTNTNWRQQAACRATSPEVFHPTERDGTGLAAARALCSRCPVQAECLAAALLVRDVHGFRAGHTGDQRRALLVRPVKQDLTDDIVRLGNMHWAASAIALRLGVDAQTVWRTLKAHREAGAA